MSIGDAVITAREMVARYGAEAQPMMEKIAHDHEAAGDAEGAQFWRRVTLAARLLTAEWKPSSNLVRFEEN